MSITSSLETARFHSLALPPSTGLSSSVSSLLVVLFQLVYKQMSWTLSMLYRYFVHTIREVLLQIILVVREGVFCSSLE